MKSRYLEEKEIKSLFSALDENELLPLLLSLETGLRIGDVVSLRVSDVKKDGVYYTAQKTRKSGVAKISAKLYRSLRKNVYKGQKWLFPSPRNNGEHITRQAVWNRLKKAGKSVGVDVDGLSPHSMRKVFAVELYRKKGFKAVQEALQHSYASTSEIYAFADWNTGENAYLPLTRRDLPLIVKMVLEALGKETR